VLGSLRSRESQRGYRHSIDEFITWYCSEPRLSFNKTVVTRYRIHLEDRQLAPGTINVRLVAVRRLAYEAADSGLVSPDLAAGIRRVKGAKKLGICRAGTIWGDGMTERIVWHVVKGVCWQAQPRRACPPRPSSVVRTPVSRGGRRDRADSIPAGPRLGTNDRKIPGVQATPSRCGE